MKHTGIKITRFNSSLCSTSLFPPSWWVVLFLPLNLTIFSFWKIGIISKLPFVFFHCRVIHIQIPPVFLSVSCTRLCARYLSIPYRRKPTECPKIIQLMGFPGSSDGIESACYAGYLALISGSGRSPGEGNGNSLQYSRLENPTNRGALWATVHRVTKSWTRLKWRMHALCARSCASRQGYNSEKHWQDF